MPGNKPSRLTFVIVFSSINIAVIVALYFIVGRPSFGYSDQMRQRFQGYQAKLQEAEELSRSLPNPQKALSDMERQNREFRETSGTARQLPKIIQLLGQSAAGRQINIVSIRPREDIKAGVDNLPPGVNKVFLEMAFTCLFQDLGEYTKVLCELPGVFTIETLNIERQAGGSARQDIDEGQLSASLILSTYIVGD